jgi:hypothetical protein
VYQELWFDVPDTYWHANGNGQDVTFDNTPGALRYATLPSANTSRPATRRTKAPR